MYADLKHVRKHTYRVCLNDDEAAAIDRLARERGLQRSVCMRELLMELVHLLNDAGTNNEKECREDGSKNPREGQKAA